MPKQEQHLHLSYLQKPDAQVVSTLGLLAIKHLLENSCASFFLDAHGFVQVAMPGELALDALPEPMAINQLTADGKSDDYIELYLKGRDARMSRHG